MTTRTHYRSSTLAFPKTAEYANSIQRFATPARADSIILYLCAFSLAFLAVLLIVEAL